MLQVTTCLTVHCDQCGCGFDDWDYEPHFTIEADALMVAEAEGWQTVDGRLLCDACATVLVCERDGHAFTAWRRSVWPGREYRWCGSCELHESRFSADPAVTA